MDLSLPEHDHHVEEGINNHFHDDPSSYNEEDDRSQPMTRDGASPGKIFIGGLARETTPAQFVKYFEKYGEITDSVIMKDRRTGQPRGFGFITYADSSVVDKVIEETHIINGKQVEIKRTIPKGAIGAKDFKTKKIFVGGIPTTVNEDEFKEFFSKFGSIKEHQIMRDHSTNRSRGFGFVTFDKEEVVDELLLQGNRIEFAGSKVEIKKAEPKKPNAPPPMRRYSDSRSSYGGGFGDSYGGSYGGGGGGFGGNSFRTGAGAYGGRSAAVAAAAAAAACGGFGSGGEYGMYGGGYGGSAMGGAAAYRGADSSYGYMSRYGVGGGGGYSRAYDMGGASSYGAGGPSDGYGSYGGAAAGGAAGYGGGSGGYESGYGGGYGAGGPMYGSSRGGAGSYSAGAGAAGYSAGAGAGTGRFHPYGR